MCLVVKAVLLHQNDIAFCIISTIAASDSKRTSYCLLKFQRINGRKDIVDLKFLLRVLAGFYSLQDRKLFRRVLQSCPWKPKVLCHPYPEQGMEAENQPSVNLQDV